MWPITRFGVWRSSAYTAVHFFLLVLVWLEPFVCAGFTAIHVCVTMVPDTFCICAVAECVIPSDGHHADGGQGDCVQGGTGPVGGQSGATAADGYGGCDRGVEEGGGTSLFIIVIGTCHHADMGRLGAIDLLGIPILRVLGSLLVQANLATRPKPQLL